MIFLLFRNRLYGDTETEHIRNSFCFHIFIYINLKLLYLDNLSVDDIRFQR
jgi:hypothetical protein